MFQTIVRWISQLFLSRPQKKFMKLQRKLERIRDETIKNIKERKFSLEPNTLLIQSRNLKHPPQKFEFPDIAGKYTLYAWFNEIGRKTQAAYVVYRGTYYLSNVLPINIARITFIPPENTEYEETFGHVFSSFADYDIAISISEDKGILKIDRSKGNLALSAQVNGYCPEMMYLWLGSFGCDVDFDSIPAQLKEIYLSHLVSASVRVYILRNILLPLENFKFYIEIWHQGSPFGGLLQSIDTFKEQLQKRTIIAPVEYIQVMFIDGNRLKIAIGDFQSNFKIRADVNEKGLITPLDTLGDELEKALDRIFEVIKDNLSS